MRDIYFKAMRIMEFKLVIVNFVHAFKFTLVHTAITICFAGNMIFYILFVSVMLCELIYKCFISTISSH